MEYARNSESFRNQYFGILPHRESQGYYTNATYSAASCSNVCTAAGTTIGATTGTTRQSAVVCGRPVAQTRLHHWRMKTFFGSASTSSVTKVNQFQHLARHSHVHLKLHPQRQNPRLSLKSK